MVHAAEGTLQAYLDGEIEEAAVHALSDHVAGCAACASELKALRRVNSRAVEALGLLDRPAPVLRARAALARHQKRRRGSMIRVGMGSLAKAAMLLLVLAGAGAAAIPDFRRALESTFARVVELFGGSTRTADESVEPVTDPPMPVEPAPEPSMTFVAPADGRVRVLLHAPSGPVEVVVQLIDGARAQIRTETTDDVRRRSGTGRLELMGLSTGTVTVGIPRTVPNATIEVDGEVRVYKDGAELRVSGPESADRGSEVRFIVGS